MIYLDHNATTPMHPEVRDAMAPYQAGAFGNPSSGHARGRAALRAVEQAREQVASLLHAAPEEIAPLPGAMIDLAAVETAWVARGPVTREGGALRRTVGRIEMQLVPDGRTLILGTRNRRKAQALFQDHVAAHGGVYKQPRFQRNAARSECREACFGAYGRHNANGQ